MTVATTTRKVQYAADGVTYEFDFSFPIQEDDDIAVIVTDADGVETALALTTNFEVSSASGTFESGGTITMVTYASGSRATYAWADTYTITIYRSTSLLQETEFRNNRQFRQSSLETALDRVVMQIQDLNERMDRIVTVPVTDTATSLELPTATARASKYLAFDADGNPIASAAGADVSAVSAFAQTILDDTTAAAVRTTIGAQASGSYQGLDATLTALAALTLTQGGLFTATGADAPAILAKGTADLKLFMNAGATSPEWAAGLSATEHTYDVSTASGTQNLTGAGFTPSAAIVIWGMTPGGVPKTGGIGIKVGAVTGSLVIVNSGALYGGIDVNFMLVGPAARNYQTATLTFTADGGSLTWTKFGSPTGTLTFDVLWIR